MANLACLCVARTRVKAFIPLQWLALFIRCYLRKNSCNLHVRVMWIPMNKRHNKSTQNIPTRTRDRDGYRVSNVDNVVRWAALQHTGFPWESNQLQLTRSAGPPASIHCSDVSSSRLSASLYKSIIKHSNILTIFSSSYVICVACHVVYGPPYSISTLPLKSDIILYPASINLSRRWMCCKYSLYFINQNRISSCHTLLLWKCYSAGKAVAAIILTSDSANV